MKRIFLTCLMLCLCFFIKAQGCSDAGFCSISGINPTHHLDSTKFLSNSFKLGITSGLAQFGVFITTPYLEYDVRIVKRITFSTKISYTIIDGSITKNHGLSDFFVSVNYQPLTMFSIINGIKTPFNQANKKYEGYNLPMSYQTTLGTVDYLFGLSLKKNKFAFSLGTQIPIIQNNNLFFVENFEPFGINPNYSSTNGYIRKSDVIARINGSVALI
jgi:hypothetical protein